MACQEVLLGIMSECELMTDICQHWVVSQSEELWVSLVMDASSCRNVVAYVSNVQAYKTVLSVLSTPALTGLNLNQMYGNAHCRTLTRLTDSSRLSQRCLHQSFTAN